MGDREAASGSTITFTECTFAFKNHELCRNRSYSLYIDPSSFTRSLKINANVVKTKDKKWYEQFMCFAFPSLRRIHQHWMRVHELVSEAREFWWLAAWCSV